MISILLFIIGYQLYREFTKKEKKCKMIMEISDMTKTTVYKLTHTHTQSQVSIFVGVMIFKEIVNTEFINIDHCF